MRRQWVDHERLLFPLVQLPLQMIEEGRPGDRFGPLPEEPPHVDGVPGALSCLLSTYGLNYYFPVVPKVDLYTIIVPFRDWGAMEILLSFTVLGLSYFLSFALSSSLWVFHLLADVQMGIQYTIGYRLSGEIEKFMEGDAHAGPPGHGGHARPHRLRHLDGPRPSEGGGPQGLALRSPGAIDDSGEMLSYRAARGDPGRVQPVRDGLADPVPGCPLWVTVVFLLVAFGVFLFMARLIAESGLGFIRPQMTAQTIVINFLGTHNVTGLGPLQPGHDLQLGRQPAHPAHGLRPSTA